MNYDFPLYRPPSEARSLILQLTLGCSHNACTFCYMYKTKKYREKTANEINEHIREAKEYYPNTRRIFLADGNVMAMDTKVLGDIVRRLYTEFSDLERVSVYAGPKDILGKSDDELLELKDSGIDMIYIGVESGSSQVLENVKKGVSQEEMIQAGQMVVKAGFKLSCMIISGLGGKELWKEHAIESAKVISAINPHYFALLTLLVEPGTVLYNQVKRGEFLLLEPEEVVEETKLMLENLEVSNCVFRSNHPSNYVNLKGVLNEDKERLIADLTRAQENKDSFTPEGWRGL